MMEYTLSILPALAGINFSYELVKSLEDQKRDEVLALLSSCVNTTERYRAKRHEVFEPSFDWKECYDEKFIERKMNYRQIQSRQSPRKLETLRRTKHFIVLDILFKSYYIFLRKNEKKGAEMAVMGLSIPLSLNFIILLLYPLSLFVNVYNFGGLVIAVFMGTVAILTALLLRFLYLKDDKYKRLTIKYPSFYYLFGVFYYLFSIFFFLSMFLSILDSGRSFN